MSAEAELPPWDGQLHTATIPAGTARAATAVVWGLIDRMEGACRVCVTHPAGPLRAWEVLSAAYWTEPEDTRDVWWRWIAREVCARYVARHDAPGTPPAAREAQQLGLALAVQLLREPPTPDPVALARELGP